MQLVHETAKALACEVLPRELLELLLLLVDTLRVLREGLDQRINTCGATVFII